MERKRQIIIFFLAMIIISIGGYIYVLNEITSPPEMENYDFGQYTMNIPKDSDVELISSNASMSLQVGNDFQTTNVNKTFYGNQSGLNSVLEQTTIENLTNSSKIVETSDNTTYYQITDENNIMEFENDTFIAINNNNPDIIIIISSENLDLLKQITPTIKNK
jgi:asparagine N-glycosylation enzyme membrane subunit Stt3